MDKMEQIANAIHQRWWEYQSLKRRALGPLRDEKSHPHMVPWSALDEESRNQDRFIAAAILVDHMRGELTLDLNPVAEAIHEAWVKWEHVHERYEHSHAKPFSIAHQEGLGEHEQQARDIIGILDRKATPVTRNPFTP